ncbi:MAG: chromosomal replication initiator protein DnaA [Ignavibacteria bacterium]|nr:chromosomal replication initiator protein DnaA [Ignavibacteria bacterium]
MNAAMALNITTPTEAWSECLKLIKEHVTPYTFNTWFSPLKAVSLESEKLTIELPNSYFYEWIDHRYNNLLNKSIKKVLGEEAILAYKYEDPQSIERREAEERAELQVELKKPMTTLIVPVPEVQKHESNLKPSFTFDNFIKGSCNQLANAAAFAISASPGTTSFNPFFIYGGVGLGKTHLAMAVGNRVQELHPNKKVIYLSLDNFFIQYVEAIKENRQQEFSSYYQTIDVLILDDIQFFIGKEKTQELFFHIFNSLHQNNKQIILTSDKPPKELRGLDERLISRFNWGLTVDIQPPDFETRLAILNKKADEYNLQLSDEILEYIAMNVTSNIRELEGCLIRLLANVTITSREIDINLAKESVQEISTTKRNNITTDAISKIVSDYMKVDENKLRDKTRKQEIVLARQMAMYLTKELTKSSLKNIGLYFGGRDHTTVIHACETIQNLSQNDTNFKETLQNVRTKIQLACS